MMIPGEVSDGFVFFTLQLHVCSRCCVFVLLSLLVGMSSSSVVEDFFAFPSEILLERCTKEELLQIAEQFDVTFGNEQ